MMIMNERKLLPALNVVLILPDRHNEALAKFLILEAKGH